jgi:protein-S-isoprenylcysteine O-methyltransferase Ste14
VNKFRLSNIPIPEGHVITLIVGIALHVWKPLDISQTTWLIHLFGGPLLLIGILLALWASATFKEMDFSKPTAIITTGPYAFSRNPMYVAWTVIDLAVAMLVNTWWLILLLPVVLLFTHFFIVRKEERQLEEKFGEAYRQYRMRVRRYF